MTAGVLPGQRSEPVFFVKMKPKAPPSPPGTGSLLRAGTLQKQVDELQKQIDAYGMAASQPGADLGLLALIEAATNKQLALRAEIAAAKKVAAAAPPPPAVQPILASDEEDITRSVMSFEYQDDEKKTALLKLTLENRDLRFFDHPIFSKGTHLFISWGYAEHMTPPHEVVITKITGSLQLTIEAQDKGVLMQKQKKSRTFENMTRAAVAAQVAQENGFGPSAQDIDDTQEVYPTVIQASSTDGTFLKRLADIEGFEFFIDFDGFHWHQRRVGQKPLRQLTYFLPPGVGDIISFNVENDVSIKPASVNVVGRDPMKKADVNATANDATTARPTLAPTPDISGTAPATTQHQVVNPATGAVTTVYDQAPANPNPLPVDQRPSTAKSNGAAQREANGVFTRTQQSAVTLTIDMVGDPSIVAKSVLKVSGLGARLSGRYYVQNATHAIASGYTLKLKLKSDGTHGAGKPATSKAKPNGKDVDTGQPGALTPRQQVDPATGRVTLQYVDTAGRPVGNDGSAPAPPPKAP